MSDDIKNPISLDPTNWEEAYEEFPGTVESVEHRLSADEYNEKAHLPEPIQQFHIVVVRDDAIYKLADGSTAPVRVYSGCDLQKKNRAGVIVPVAPGENKPTFMLTQFAKAKVVLSTDPEKLAALKGVKCMWRRYRTMSFPGGFQAKNILYPVQVLSPDYKFAGEVQEFTVSATPAESLEDAAGATPEADAATREELVEALAGTDESFDADALSEEPFRRASGADKTALVRGEFQEAAVADGLLKVEDGKLVQV